MGYGSAVDCCRGRVAGCSRPGSGISPFGGGRHQPHHRAGKQSHGGHKQNLVHTRTQEKGAATPQETDPELPVSIQESLVEAWVSVGGTAAGWGALSAAVCVWDLLKEFTIIFITSTIVCSQVKQRGENTSTENWIKDLLSLAPTIRTRPNFPHSQSLPSGSFHKPVILIHQGADSIKRSAPER